MLLRTAAWKSPAMRARLQCGRWKPGRPRLPRSQSPGGSGRLWGRRPRRSTCSILLSTRGYRWATPFEKLALLGVRPDCQNRGLGSALLAYHLAGLDRRLVPAYLEASSKASRELYLRFGFFDLGEPMSCRAAHSCTRCGASRWECSRVEVQRLALCLHALNPESPIAGAQSRRRPALGNWHPVTDLE